MQTQTLIAILMGSGSDWPVVKEAADTLARFGVPMEVHVLSAHRTPDAAAEFSRTAVARGLKVLIAAAGGAAHLAGVLAAHTTLPVIGIPMQSALNGLDSLLSTVQMPAGIPVATVAIGKPGAANAALLAVQILALNDEVLQRGLQQHKETIKQKAAEADAQIQAEWLAASDLTPQQKFTQVCEPNQSCAA